MCAVIPLYRFALWSPLLVLEDIDTSLAAVTTGNEPVESQFLVLALHHDVTAMNVLVAYHEVFVTVRSYPAVIHTIDASDQIGRAHV